MFQVTTEECILQRPAGLDDADTSLHEKRDWSIFDNTVDELVPFMLKFIPEALSTLWLGHLSRAQLIRHDDIGHLWDYAPHYPILCTCDLGSKAITVSLGARAAELGNRAYSKLYHSDCVVHI